MILLSHPTGNENVRQALLALEGAGLLSAYWTTLGWGEERAAWIAGLPRALSAELGRRVYRGIPTSKIHRWPWREVGRLIAGRARWEALVRHETGPFSVDAIYRGLDLRVARAVERQGEGLRAVYCYEDGARETFRATRRAGARAIYELPIGYWRVGREIQEEEAALNPAWAGTLGGVRDSAGKLERKDEEIALADIVLVASGFAERGLTRVPGGVRAAFRLPYGCPEPVDEVELGHGDGEVLRVLFVGGLSQRKGLSYLFAAMGMMGGGARLTLIGERCGECAALDRELGRHRWLGSLPRREVLREMCRHDALVFPSLFEGYGLVIAEALACGLPVITTPHTAGPELLTEGEDGFIVPIRSAEAIAACLESIRAHPDRLREMRKAALAKARSRPWDGYREALIMRVTHES